MKLYVCTDKHYKNNSVDQYLLKDLRSDKEIVVSAQELKENIRNKKVDVMNLQLTADNRLIEAGKYKTDQIVKILKAPESVADRLRPLSAQECDAVEQLMDEIMHECISSYVKRYNKYIKLEEFNKENNTCVLEFTLGPNSFFMLSYDKICYGVAEKNEQWDTKLVFDIAIKAVAVSNRKESLKIETEKYLLASVINTCRGLNHGENKAVFITMEDNGNLDMKQINEIKNNLGKELLDYIRKVTLELCENNPNIIDNVNVAEYVEYDETKKSYYTNKAQIASFGLIGTVIFGGIIAAGVALNPDIMQTALLAKIANIASPGQVIGALSGGLGLLGGATATLGVLRDDIEYGRDLAKNLEDNPKDYKQAAKDREAAKQEAIAKAKREEEKKKSVFNMFKR